MHKACKKILIRFVWLTKHKSTEKYFLYVTILNKPKSCSFIYQRGFFLSYLTLQKINPLKPMFIVRSLILHKEIILPYHITLLFTWSKASSFCVSVPGKGNQRKRPNRKDWTPLRSLYTANLLPYILRSWR